jgi:acetoacetate decarboxylase
VTESEVKDRAFAMPLTSPAFPPGPWSPGQVSDLTLGLGTVIHDYLA